MMRVAGSFTFFSFSFLSLTLGAMLSRGELPAMSLCVYAGLHVKARTSRVDNKDQIMTQDQMSALSGISKTLTMELLWPVDNAQHRCAFDFNRSMWQGRLVCDGLVMMLMSKMRMLRALNMLLSVLLGQADINGARVGAVSPLLRHLREQVT